MTDRELLELAAKAAGWESWDWLEDFAALVAAAEREACVRVCETHTVDDVLVGVGIAQSCAASIRARGARPDCEHHKQRAALWRHAACRLSGTPLPWDADEAIAKAVAAEREACAQIADEWATREQKQFGNGGPGSVIRARGEK